MKMHLACCHSLIIVRTKEKANVLIRKNCTAQCTEFTSIRVYGCYNMLFCNCIFLPLNLSPSSSSSFFVIIIIISIPLRLLCNETDTLNIVHTHAIPKILQAVPYSLLCYFNHALGNSNL